MNMSTNSNSEPQVNIDGAPMVPDANIDINGNPFGVTDSATDSIFDVVSDMTNDSFGCDFDSSFDSGFDSFSSGFDDF